MQYSVPGQPQDVRVEHANTSAVALMWSGAKIRNNHVESYFVNYTAMDEHMEGVRGGSMVVSEPQIHCLLLGLDEYREYSVVVTGVNAMGHGAHSSYFTFQTPGKGVHAYMCMPCTGHVHNSIIPVWCCHVYCTLVAHTVCVVCITA